MLTNNKNAKQQIRSLYTPLPDEKKPKASESFPWRTWTIPSKYVTTMHNSSKPATDLHVASYNPMGKGLKPPQPIIFLSGISTNHKIFSSVARELNYPYGLVAMDFHTRGRSAKQVNPDTSNATLKAHVYDLLRVLRSCEQAHSFIVGHGYGGFVGQMAMKLFPNRISGLVLLDSGFPKNEKLPLSADDQSAFPPHVLTGFQKELELITAENISSEELREQFFGKNSDEWYNEIDINDFIKYTLENRDRTALRSAAITDLHGLTNELLTIDDLFKLRHPLAVVRAEKGFPFADMKNDKPVLDDKSAKILQSELNVKDKVVTLKGANHYSLLTNKKYVSEVAKAIESLVCRYDLHWRVTMLSLLHKQSLHLCKFDSYWSLFNGIYKNCSL